MSENYWSFRECQKDNREELGTLPRSVPEENVKETLRALAARELSTQEVLCCGYSRRFKCRSSLLDVERLDPASKKSILYAIDWGDRWFEAELDIRSPL